jgi:hypothetical protein
MAVVFALVSAARVDTGASVTNQFSMTPGGNVSTAAAFNYETAATLYTLSITITDSGRPRIFCVQCMQACLVLCSAELP